MKQWFDLSMSHASFHPQGGGSPPAAASPAQPVTAPANAGGAWLSDALKAWCTPDANAQS
ncbi:MAG: hypothetical protein EOP38_00635 [Rubrivivax sp.]|nr:MAG: hypothetical protein EOP38_00635 [Rubrivivax sp.]